MSSALPVLALAATALILTLVMPRVLPRMLWLRRTPASALALWLQLLQPGGTALLARGLAGFFSFMQMGLLGALLTFSPTLLYESHLATTLAWGLSPLADQQLGGMIMWIPGCGVVLLAMLYGILSAIREATRATVVAPDAPQA